MKSISKKSLLFIGVVFLVVGLTTFLVIRKINPNYSHSSIIDSQSVQLSSGETTEDISIKKEFKNLFFIQSGMAYWPFESAITGVDIKTFACSDIQQICWDHNNIYNYDGQPNIIPIDENAVTIDNYYSLIKQHRLNDALLMRTSTVDLGSFKQKYAYVDDILIYDVKKLTSNSYGFFEEIIENSGENNLYYVEVSINANGKLIELGSISKIQDFPKEIRIENMKDFYTSKTIRKYTDIAEFGGRNCNRESGCDSLLSYKTLLTTEYNIRSKKLLPSYVFNALSGLEGKSFFIIDNIKQLPIQEAKGLVVDGVDASPLVDINNKYILFRSNKESIFSEYLDKIVKLSD